VRDPSTESGDRLWSFLVSWYGPPSSPPAREAPEFGDLPRSIRRWHQFEQAWGFPLSLQNRIATEDSTSVDHGKRVIAIENQAVWLWGVDPTEPTTTVYERENDRDEPWTPIAENVDDFLLHFAMVEAVLGAPVGATIIDATVRQRDEVLTGFSRVQVATWRWPGPEHALWQRPSAMALSCANARPDEQIGDDATYSVFIGARQPDPLAFLGDLPVPWDHTWDDRRR
jgi:hypothetical protein